MMDRWIIKLKFSTLLELYFYFHMLNFDDGILWDSHKFEVAEFFQPP